MLKVNNEHLKIQSAVLKAVRKVSGAQFNKKLEGYCLNFSAAFSVGVLSFNITKGEDYCDVFYFSVPSPKSAFFNTLIPISVFDIERFEADVERGLAQVFEFIKGDK